MTEQAAKESRFDKTLLLQKFHVIRLGYLTHFDNASTLTIGDHAGGNKRGMKLKPEYVALLASLDPTINNREFIFQHLGLINWMAEKEFLAIIKFNANISSLNMVPVPRLEMELVENLEEGYRLVPIGGEPFIISELGSRFLSSIDGYQTMGEIVENVKQGVLTDPNEYPMVAKNEQEKGQTFDEILMDEAFAFIKAVIGSGAVSFEPSPE